MCQSLVNSLYQPVTSPVKRPELPNVWNALQDQLKLGDDEFAGESRLALSSQQLNDSEIPRLQRQAKAAPLSVFAAMPV